MTKWSHRQLEIVKADHFDVSFWIDCMTIKLSELGELRSMYVKADHFDVSFQLRCMIIYLNELDELWSMYVKADYFDMSFRSLFGHMVIQPRGLFDWVWGNAWVKRCYCSVDKIVQLFWQA